MAATCEGCGVAIDEGAFLGMCADCGAGRGEAPRAPMSARASGGMTGARLALIAGAGILALIVVVFFLFLGAPVAEAPMEAEPTTSTKESR